MEKLIVISITLNLLIIFFFNQISKFVNIFDYPSERKIHTSPTPILGGLIIYLNLIIYFFYIIIIDNSLQKLLFLENLKMISLFIFTSTTIFLIGIFDDKFDISPHVRLISFILLVSNFLYFDNSSLIEILNFSFNDTSFDLRKTSFIFTLLCFLVFMISLNMYDGTNLQSSLFYFYIIIYFLIQNFELNLFLLYIGISILFFFYKNFNGKTFLGDGGTYLLSFLFAYLIIHNHTYLDIKSDEIVMLIIFPIIDALRLYIVRIINKKNPFFPDQNHFHHLLKKRFNEQNTMFLLILILILPLTIYKLLNNSLFSLFIFIIFYTSTILIFKKKNKNL